MILVFCKRISILLVCYLITACDTSTEQDYKISDEKIAANFQKSLGYYAEGQFDLAYIELLRNKDSHHAPSLHSMAVLHERGQSVSQDFLNAKLWYEKAATLGYAPSQFALGQLYEDGLGVDRDFKTALSWYQKSALQNNPEAVKAVTRIKKSLDK